MASHCPAKFRWVLWCHLVSIIWADIIILLFDKLLHGFAKESSDNRGNKKAGLNKPKSFCVQKYEDWLRFCNPNPN